MVNKMTLPSRRTVNVPTRERGNPEGKSQEEVIAEAKLKTNPAEQTNPEPELEKDPEVEDKKPWLKGSNLTEAELMNLTTKKSFNFPLLIQAKLDFILEEQKKAVRGFGQRKPTESLIVIEALDRELNKELRKLGYDVK